MTRLFFIRHADAYDEKGIQDDEFPLNNFGRVQALQLAKRLRENKFDAMYCSRIRRSMETCEIVNENHNMDVRYTARLNEVGGPHWPQPGFIVKPKSIEDYYEASERVYSTFKWIVEKNQDKETIVFTHGNWIRVLLSKVLADSNPVTFTHFVISNSSLTILDIDSEGFEHIITVSDAAHTHLYDTRI